MAPQAIRRAAQLDMGFACNLGLKEINQYHQALRELGKDPAAYSVVNSRMVYVADTEEQAWREIEPYLMYQMALYGKWLSEGAIETVGHFAPTRKRCARTRYWARRTASSSACGKLLQLRQ